VFFHSAGMSFGNLRKGTDVLIKAWGRLSKKEKMSSRLVIHSQREPDALYEQQPRLRRIVERDNIELVIGTMKPPYGYHLGNVYVYPAMVDSIGLTMPESLGCGMPMITTAAAPFDEFVEDGENGLLVKARKRSWSSTYGAPDKMGCWTVNLEPLTDALRFFIDNRQQITRMGRASRAMAERKFDFMKNFQQMDVLLEHVTARAGSTGARTGATQLRTRSAAEASGDIPT
jgi:1,2-diacylglycerol 3-alpha-glucosyltransferase